MNKHYIKPNTTTVQYDNLMDNLNFLVTSTEKVNPRQALGRRFADSWDFNQEVADVENIED